MFEEIKIKIWGHQPIPDISSKTIEKIIQRDYSHCVDEVKEKLSSLNFNSLKAKNRTFAAILKLSNGETDKIDKYIEMYKEDLRDVLANAEYPLCFSSGFGKKSKQELKSIYLADWKNYTSWLNKK